MSCTFLQLMVRVIDGTDDRWIREIRQEILNYILSKGEKGRKGEGGWRSKLCKLVYPLGPGQEVLQEVNTGIRNESIFM